MADIGIMKDALEWRDFYPVWGGINEGNDDKWFFKIRRAASRSEARRALIGMRSSFENTDDIDLGVLTAAQHVQGPFNLTDGDESLDNIGLVAFVEKYDAHDLVTEIQDEIRKSLELDGDEVGNSGAPSGGDTASKDGADPKEASEGSPPAEPADETPEPDSAPEATTPDEASP